MSTTYDSATIPELELLVLQPTPFCNINCSYCYLPTRQNRDTMDFDTVRNTIRWLREFEAISDHLSIVWHAGEPLVLPISYYKKAFSAIKEELPNHIAIDHSIQSNGMLLSEDWCHFIKSENIFFGVSIDGPAFINDKFRKTRTGRGTLHKAMAGIRLLQKHDIDFHVIAVLTDHSLEFPDEIFDFFDENDIRQVGFNIDEIEAANTSSSLQEPTVELRFRAFMERLLYLVKRTDCAIEVREFQTNAQMLLAPPEACVSNQQTTPFSIISVDCYGNLSTFSPELLGASAAEFSSFNFGNVNRDSPLTVLRDPGFLRVSEQIAQGVELCSQSCDYFDFCGGGAPANKIFETDTFASSETLYCRLTKKALVDIVLSDMEAFDDRQDKIPYT